MLHGRTATSAGVSDAERLQLRHRGRVGGDRGLAVGHGPRVDCRRRRCAASPSFGQHGLRAPAAGAAVGDGVAPAAGEVGAGVVGAGVVGADVADGRRAAGLGEALGARVAGSPTALGVGASSARAVRWFR